MRTKKSLVESYVRSGEYKKALSICKEWKLPISEEESDTLRRGYECMIYPRLYEQIGYNPAEEIQKSVAILNQIYVS